MYEKSTLFTLNLPERFLFNCDATGIAPANNQSEILSYLSGTEIGSYMDILKFDYPPYNEYNGNLTVVYSDHSHDYSNPCKVTFRRAYMFVYEYYGEMYSNIVSENINALRYDNTYESFEVEIDGDTLSGFESFHLPTPMKDIWEFADEKKGHSEIYCVQPLVVQRKTEDVREKIRKKLGEDNREFEAFLKKVINGTWNVVDGQQRLTTIYLILTALEEKYPNKFTVAKLDVDDEPSIAQRYGITTVPTLIVFKKGSPVQRAEGVQTVDKLEVMLGQA
jgi:thioredoxin 1